MSGTLTCASKTLPARSREPDFLPWASRMSIVAISDTLARRRLDRGPHHDEPAFGTGNGTTHEQQVATGVGLHDLQVQHGDPLVAVLARHAHALEHPAGRRACADRSRRSVHTVGAVARLQTTEAVTLHHARETLALGHTDHVDD